MKKYIFSIHFDNEEEQGVECRKQPLKQRW